MYTCVLEWVEKDGSGGGQEQCSVHPSFPPLEMCRPVEEGRSSWITTFPQAHWDKLKADVWWEETKETFQAAPKAASTPHGAHTPGRTVIHRWRIILMKLGFHVIQRESQIHLTAPERQKKGDWTPWTVHTYDAQLWNFLFPFQSCSAASGKLWQ